MASNADFVQYIIDQTAGAGQITARKMFGDYAIYCNRKIFGLICDDRLYIKPTEAGKKVVRDLIPCPPYEGAKDYFYIPEVDDREYLQTLVKESCKELPEPKRKNKKQKNTEL